MLRTIVNKFNRGEVDRLAVVRQDVTKILNSCRLMENWMPIKLGPMMVRPGLEYLVDIPGKPWNEPFVASIENTAIIQFTDDSARVLVDDTVVARTGRTAAFTNGTFNTDLTGWTDDSSGAGASAWETGGYAKLTGDGSSEGAIYQTLTITETGLEHGIRLVILNAPVKLQIGTTVGGSEVFSGTLLPGTHSLSVTPTGNLTFRLSNSKKYAALVDSIAVEGTGEMSFATGIAEASMPLIRTAQSADVMYLSCDGVVPQQFERRGQRSWSLVDFRSDLGPFRVINTSAITMQAGALNGDTTLTASDDFFEAGHVGALFKVASTSQNVEATVSSGGNGTGSIRVAGVGNVRRFSISVTNLTGTGSTVTLQRSTDELTWEDIESYTTNTSKNYDDGLNNSILFYRLFIKVADYSSGSIDLVLNYASGSIEGICRVTGLVSTTVVNVQVLQDFGSTDASLDWYEGAWSDKRGYPSATALYESRLWWAGKTKVWGSVSDAFTAFGGDEEGDSRTIQKTIGFGPVDTISWLAPTTRLLMGLASDEISIRSDSFGAVLTQSNTNLKPGTNQGSAPIAPARVDTTVFFIQRSLVKMFGLTYSLDSDTHSGSEATTLNPGILRPGVVKIVAARQPETRVFALLSDGTVRVYLNDVAENVEGWSRISTVGTIEDIVVLPGESEDRVYFSVNRANGRTFEKMALESEAIGGDINVTVDGAKRYVSPSTVVTGLDHLDGYTVGVWADGTDIGDADVSGGQITVLSGIDNLIVGLRYNADYRSNRISEYTEDFNHGRNKRIEAISFIAQNIYRTRFWIGPDENSLQQLPAVEDGSDAAVTGVTAEYDELPVEFDGAYDTNPEIFIRATGPATLLGMVIHVDDPDYQAAQGG